MQRSKLTLAAVLSVAGLSIAGLSTPALAQDAAPAAPAGATHVAPSGDIIATLTASGQFTTLLKALDATNLTAVLKSAGPLTLFAPTDAAFAAMPAGQLDQLMNASPPAALQQLLVYHIVNAKVDAAKIKGAKGPIPTVAQKPIYVDGSGDPPKVNGADITQTDLTVSNGVIYPVDQVLSPSFTPPPADAAAADDTPKAAPRKKR